MLKIKEDILSLLSYYCCLLSSCFRLLATIWIMSLQNICPSPWDFRLLNVWFMIPLIVPINLIVWSSSTSVPSIMVFPINLFISEYVQHKSFGLVLWGSCERWALMWLRIHFCFLSFFFFTNIKVQQNRYFFCPACLLPSLIHH